MTNPILLDIPEELLTERLILRVPRPGDGKGLFEATEETREQLLQWMPWARETLTPDDSEEFVRKAAGEFILREALNFLMIDTDSGKIIGSTGLHHIDWKVPRFEIGYWIARSFQHRGLVTEAVLRLKEFCFTELGAERITIVTDSRNKASEEVAIRCGFMHEGTYSRWDFDNQGELRSLKHFVSLASQEEKSVQNTRGF